MSYLAASPDGFASAVAGIDRIRSDIDAASSTAAGCTAGVVAAGEDEVSKAVATLFDSYAAEYQALVGRAGAFHADFTQALATAAGAYSAAEAGNVALAGREAARTVLSAVSNAIDNPLQSLQTLLRAVTIGTGGSPLSANAAQQVALILGYTGDALPDLDYLLSVNASFVEHFFPGYAWQTVFTPEQFWPVTPQLGNLTFGESVAQGVALLNSAINTQLQLGNNVVVFGYSQSATVITDEIRALMAAGSPGTGDLSFVLVGNPNNPDGGLLTRFPGFYIPFLDVAFNGATPPNSPYQTYIYTAQYDGIADAPQYPLNVLSDINAIMGYFYVHDTYPMLTATQVSNAVPLPTSPGYTGDTHYYMLMTQNLPLVEPIREIPYAGPVIADLIQPDLRVLVDLGYSDYGTSYANVPTPAGLFSLANPFVVVPDLVNGAFQGVQGAAVEIGVEAGFVSPTLFPDTYPYVPSTDPGLNFYLGQPQTTLLSQLSGDLGDVLSLIPPIYY